MFYNKEHFPFYQVLEENWEIIRDEYLKLREYQLQPWFQKEIYNGDWKVFGFFDWPSGAKMPGATYCPNTVSIIEDNITGYAAAGFSILKPNTVIEPHVGYQGDFLRCHLGLVIPDQCVLDIRGEQKSWKEGEVMIFDDTFEHSAWNKSGQDRAILLLDFKKYEHHPKSFYEEQESSYQLG